MYNMFSRHPVTRRALLRAFSSPARTHRETVEIVARYMSGNTLPPMWARGGVYATFGKSVGRAWARKIRHLGPAGYRTAPGGRIVYVAVQSVEDFRDAAATYASFAPFQGDTSPLQNPMPTDEFPMLCAARNTGNQAPRIG